MVRRDDTSFTFGTCSAKSNVAGGGTRSSEWWPCNLRLDVLRQNAAESNPYGGNFDYISAFNARTIVFEDCCRRVSFALRVGPCGCTCRLGVVECVVASVLDCASVHVVRDSWSGWSCVRVGSLYTLVDPALMSFAHLSSFYCSAALSLELQLACPSALPLYTSQKLPHQSCEVLRGCNPAQHRFRNSCNTGSRSSLRLRFLIPFLIMANCSVHFYSHISRPVRPLSIRT